MGGWACLHLAGAHPAGEGGSGLAGSAAPRRVIRGAALCHARRYVTCCVCCDGLSYAGPAQAIRGGRRSFMVRLHFACRPRACDARRATVACGSFALVFCRPRVCDARRAAAVVRVTGWLFVCPSGRRFAPAVRRARRSFASSRFIADGRRLRAGRLTLFATTTERCRACPPPTKGTQRGVPGLPCPYRHACAPRPRQHPPLPPACTLATAPW